MSGAGERRSQSQVVERRHRVGQNTGGGETPQSGPEHRMSGTRLRATLQEVLISVLERFPFESDELEDGTKMCIKLEKMWWEYEDKYADTNPLLPHYRTLKIFGFEVVKLSPVLSSLYNETSYLRVYREYSGKKSKTPICGCIVLSTAMEILLVSAFYSKGWTVPRGHEEEVDDNRLATALRETYEEIGRNIAPYLLPSSSFNFSFTSEGGVKIEEEAETNQGDKAPGGAALFPSSGTTHSSSATATVVSSVSSVGGPLRLDFTEHGRDVTYFVAVGVPRDMVFEPQLHKEILDVKFHSLNRLPKTLFGLQPILPKILQIVKTLTGGRSLRQSSSSSSRSTPMGFLGAGHDPSAVLGSDPGSETWKVREPSWFNTNGTNNRYGTGGNFGRPWQTGLESSVAFMCPDCDKLFKSSSACEQHRATTHPGASVPELGLGLSPADGLPSAWSNCRCDGCGEKFKSETALMQHQETSIGCRRKKRYDARFDPSSFSRMDSEAGPASKVSIWQRKGATGAANGECANGKLAGGVSDEANGGTNGEANGAKPAAAAGGRASKMDRSSVTVKPPQQSASASSGAAVVRPPPPTTPPPASSLASSSMLSDGADAFAQFSQGRNVRVITTATGRSAFVCTACSRLFETQLALRTHWADKHDERVTHLSGPGHALQRYGKGGGVRAGVRGKLAGTARLRCKLCKLTFGNATAFAQHNDSTHSMSSALAMSSANAAADANAVPGAANPNPFPCPHCTKKCASESALLQHLDMKHPEGSGKAAAADSRPPEEKQYFRCTKCAKLMAGQSALLQHLASKHGDETIDYGLSIEPTSPGDEDSSPLFCLPAFGGSPLPAALLADGFEGEGKGGANAYFPCLFCDKALADGTALTQHMYTKHLTEIQSTGPSPVNAPFSNSVRGAMGTGTNKSGASANGSSFLFLAATAAPDSDVFHCPHPGCSKVLSSDVARAQHLAMKHVSTNSSASNDNNNENEKDIVDDKDNKVEGDNSNKTGTTSTKVTTANSDFKCETCFKLFRDKVALMQHARKHIDAVPAAAKTTKEKATEAAASAEDSGSAASESASAIGGVETPANAAAGATSAHSSGGEFKSENELVGKALDLCFSMLRARGIKTAGAISS